MAAELLLDLAGDHGASAAVGDAMDDLDGLVIQGGKLEQVGVGDEIGDRPGARGGHVHLALDQRLGDVQVGEQLAAGEEFGLDAAVRGSLQLRQVVADRDVAAVAGGSVKRAAQADRIGGMRLAESGQGQKTACNGASGEMRHGSNLGRLAGFCQNAERDARETEAFTPGRRWRLSACR